MHYFLTAEEYAEQNNITPSAVHQQVKRGELNEINIKQDLHKLVYPNDKKINEIIAFMNLKGGAGKTTLSVNFGILLSKLGLKVLIIDTDHQNHTRLHFQDLDYKKSILDVIDNPDKIRDCIYTAHSGSAIVDVIFSSHNLSFKIMDITEENLIKNALDSIKSDYDIIVIDTAPNFDMLSLNVAKAATSIIIPLKPEPFHYEGMNHYIGTLVTRCNINPKDVLKAMFFNQVVDSAQHKAYIEVLKSEFSNLCIDTVIPMDKQIPKTVDILAGTRTNIFDFREKCKASQAIKRATWEILRRL